MISSWGVPGGAIVHPISMLRIAGTVREGFSGDCKQITSGQWSLIDSERVLLALSESDRVRKCRGASKGWQVVLVIFFTGCDNGLTKLDRVCRARRCSARFDRV